MVDISDLKVKVVEHRAEVKKCLKCRRKNVDKLKTYLGGKVNSVVL